MKFAEVIWKDAVIMASEFTFDELRKNPLFVQSCGYLIVNNKDGVVLARDLMSDNVYRDSIFIPRIFIVKIRIRNEQKRLEKC